MDMQIDNKLDFFRLIHFCDLVNLRQSGFGQKVRDRKPQDVLYFLFKLIFSDNFFLYLQCAKKVLN